LTTSANVATTGIFLQDRWTPTRKLTVIPGIRFDWGRLSGDPSLPNGGFLTNLYGIGPRIGATYDVFGDRKSLIVAHYGRSNDVGSVFIAQHANPTLTVVQSTFNAGTGTFAPCGDPSTFTPSANCQELGGASGRSFATGLTAPSDDQISLGFHQEVAPLTSVGLDFNYDAYNHMFEEQEVNQIWDPSGTRVVGYADPTHPQPIFKIVTPSSAYRTYYAGTLWVEGAPGDWDLLASYTLSYDWGTVGDYFDSFLDNPRFIQYWTGWVKDDTRHQFKAAITYKAPIGLDLGLRARYQTGTPVWENFANPGGSQFSVWRSPQGTCFINSPSTNTQNFNDPSTWVECRNPDRFIVDFSARYNLGQAMGLKQKLEITLLVVDVLNNYGPTAVTSRYTPGGFNKFGYATGANGPFQAELFLRFRN
jgi:hypothetical protein